MSRVVCVPAIRLDHNIISPHPVYDQDNDDHIHLHDYDWWRIVISHHKQIVFRPCDGWWRRCTARYSAHFRAYRPQTPPTPEESGTYDR